MKQEKRKHATYVHNKLQFPTTYVHKLIQLPNRFITKYNAQQHRFISKFLKLKTKQNANITECPVNYTA